MSETKQENRRRWVGYMCPACNAIFRVEAGNGGRRAVCPLCEVDIRLPLSHQDGAQRPARPAGTPVATTVPSPQADTAPPHREATPAHGESSPPENIPPRGTATPGEKPEPVNAPSYSEEADDPANDLQFRQAEQLPEGVESPVRRRRRNRPKEIPDWEKPEAPRQKLSIFAVISIFGVLSLLVAAGAAALIFRNSKSRALDPAYTGSYTEGPLIIPRRPVPERVPETIPAQLPGTDIDLDATLVEIEQAVHAFFAAKSVEELAATTLGGESTAAKMRAYYQDRPIHPAGVLKVAPNGQLQTTGKFNSIIILLDDYSTKPIALKRVDGKFRIDWESWVAWCQMDWTDLMDNKPTHPVLMRVRCSPVNYYNFDFDDESRWECFRMLSADNIHAIYGYAPRNSILAQQLGPGRDSLAARALTVMVRYPEGATRGDQIIVDSLVTAGWVVSEDTP